MNHVPNDALEAVDAFGESLLTGTQSAFSATLREDLRLRVDPDEGGATARCRYEVAHTRTEPTLRAYGSFVTTVVDNVDERFRSWGVEPPAAYEYVETADGRHRYAGRLRTP
ncbi:MAG: hypothetical protein ABEJ79_02455 [Halolamina sp.]